MLRSRHAVALSVSLACVAACASPAASPTRSPAASPGGGTSGPGTNNVAKPGPGSTPSPSSTSAPVSAPPVVQAVAASITGRVVAPARLVAAGGLNLIGNNGNTLIGMDGGSMVAAGAGNMVAAGAGNMVAAGAGNMVAAGAGNMVAAGAGNYALAQASPAPASARPTPPPDAVSRPVARARVFLTMGDVPLPIPAVETDEDGNYRFPAVPAGVTYQVMVSIITPEGKTGRLSALVKAEATGAVADVTPITTMVCAAVVADKTKLGDLDPAKFREATDALTKAVAEKTDLIDLTRPESITPRVDDLLKTTEAGRAAVEALKTAIETNARAPEAAAQLITRLNAGSCPAPAVVLGREGFKEVPADMPETPSALATGPGGRLWVTDPATDNVLAYEGTKQVEKFGAEGRVKGLASVALAVDPDGAVYVADAESGQAARKLSSGTWQALSPKDAFIEPSAIAIRGADVYVADAGRHQIFRLDPKGGAPTVVAGSKAGFVEGRAARFNRPSGLAFVGEDLVVADAGNRRLRAIRFIDGGGTEVRTLAGGGPGNVDGQGAKARFGYPASLVSDPSDGTLWVADAGNRAIRHVAGDVVESVFQGGCRLEANGLGFVGGLALQDGALYALDGDRVARWTLKAAPSPTPVASPTGSPGPSASPSATPSGTPTATPSAGATLAPGGTPSPTPAATSTP